MNLQLLFQQAIQHQREHGCSAHPYESYEKLFAIVTEAKPGRILEIGTGMGFTTLVMARASADAQIDTLEKDPAHASLAQQFIEQQSVANRLTIYNEVAEKFLGKLQQRYDLIFFDGYQIHQEFLPHYQRLLTAGGILVLGNNQLTSKTSEAFFSDLNDSTQWQILEQFADTTIAKKL